MVEQSWKNITDDWGMVQMAAGVSYINNDHINHYIYNDNDW